MKIPTTIQPHILCSKKDIADFVLLPGDPARAELIGKKYLKKSTCIAKSREFTTYTGFYGNKRVSVTSTGIGCPSTAIAVEELINLGAKVLIRVGTCGGALKKEIKPGSIVIPTACIREEGTTREYLPYQFPAVADYRLVQTLEFAARKLNFRYFIGINRTHDAFYGQSRNIKEWGSPYLDTRMRSWDYPVISSEMECSALFLIASMRGVKAGAVLAVNSHPETLEDIVVGKQQFTIPRTKIKTQEADKSIDRTIRTALEAITMMKFS